LNRRRCSVNRATTGTNNSLTDDFGGTMNTTDQSHDNSTTALGKRIDSIAQPTYSYDYDNPSEAAAGYSRLHDYIRSARNHLWLIAGVVVVITALVGFYMLRQPD